MPVRSGKAKVTLPTEDQIRIEREFDAPKHLVYKALTTPELVKRWFHANRGVVSSAEIDLRVGGKWRYVSEADNFGEIGFHGEYRELVPNERIVWTEFYEGVPEGVTEEEATTVNTATLTETDARTLATVLDLQAPSKMTRNARSTWGWKPGCRTHTTCSRTLRAPLVDAVCSPVGAGPCRGVRCPDDGPRQPRGSGGFADKDTREAGARLPAARPRRGARRLVRDAASSGSRSAAASATLAGLAFRTRSAFVSAGTARLRTHNCCSAPSRPRRR